MTITAIRYATVNDVPLDTHAWRVVDKGYDDLLRSPALRGEDTIMPGAHGGRPNPRFRSPTIITIPLLIVGEYDEDGDPIDDPMEGLFQHEEYLNANLGLPGNTGVDPDYGTVDMTFVRGGSLENWEGPVTVIGLTDFTVLDDIKGDAAAFLDISIPAGKLVASGS